MTMNNVLEAIHKGFRLTVGATASVVETLQDAEKRDTTLADLKTKLVNKVQEWVDKGEITEQEARKIVENFLTQFSKQPPQPTSTNTTDAELQAEIKQLTEQVIALKAELEKLRQSKQD